MIIFPSLTPYAYTAIVADNNRELLVTFTPNFERLNLLGENDLELSDELKSSIRDFIEGSKSMFLMSKLFSPYVVQLL
jgi:hypothetical protein